MLTLPVETFQTHSPIHSSNIPRKFQKRKHKIRADLGPKLLKKGQTESILVNWHQRGLNFAKWCQTWSKESNLVKGSLQP